MNALIAIKEDRTASQESLLSTCRVTKEAAELAIWTHYLAAMDFKASKAWKATYKSWESCCADNCRDNKSGNPVSLYVASYYRTLGSALPIAQAVELVTGEMLLPTAARGIQAKINELVPEDERAPEFVLAMLGLSYAAYPDSVVPAKNVLDEAYQILAEERDSGTITTPSGETFVLKNEAHIQRLKERVLIDRMNGNKPRLSLRINVNQVMLAILRLAGGKDKKLPALGAEITVLWNEADS